MKYPGSKNPMMRGAQQVSTEMEPVISLACNDRLDDRTDNDILEGSEDNNIVVWSANLNLGDVLR